MNHYVSLFVSTTLINIMNKKMTYLHPIQATTKHIKKILNGILVIWDTESSNLDFNPILLY